MLKVLFLFKKKNTLHFFKTHFSMSSLIMKKEINYKTSEKYFMNCVGILSNRLQKCD